MAVKRVKRKKGVRKGKAKGIGRKTTLGGGPPRVGVGHGSRTRGIQVTTTTTTTTTSTTTTTTTTTV